MSEIEIFIKNPLRLDAEEWFEGTIEGYINYEMENFIDKNLKDKIQSLQSQLKAKVAAEATKDEIIKVLKENAVDYADEEGWQAPPNYIPFHHMDKGNRSRNALAKVAEIEKGLKDE